jgi:hypothetical protein
MKEIDLLQEEIIVKEYTCTKFLKIFFSRTTGPKFNQTWYKLSLGEENSGLNK